MDYVSNKLNERPLHSRILCKHGSTILHDTYTIHFLEVVDPSDIIGNTFRLLRSQAMR